MRELNACLRERELDGDAQVVVPPPVELPLGGRHAD